MAKIELHSRNLASDGEHGNRGGGSLHALATTLAAGFMSPADKAQLAVISTQTLTFRPGGVDGNGVVTTWAQVIDFADAAATPWRLFVDCVVQQAEVPAGTFVDFRNLCSIEVLSTVTNAFLLVKDTAVIANPYAVITGAIAIEAITTYGLLMDLEGGLLRLREGGAIVNGNGVSLVPAVRVTASNSVIATLEGARIGAEQPITVVEYTATGGFHIIAQLLNSAGGFSSISDNAFAADATTTHLVIHDNTVRLGPQSGLLGTIIYVPIAYSNFNAWHSGDTAGRPSYATTGQPYYDTDLGTNVFKSGSGWDITPRKVSADIGDGSSTSIDVTHNLNTRDIQVEVYTNASPWDTVQCDVERPDTNTVRLIFAVAPTSSEFRVVVTG